MRLFAAVVLTVCAAHAQLTVDETATHAQLRNRATYISLALDNRQTQPLDVRIELEWIDPAGARVRQVQLLYTAPPGASRVEPALPLAEKPDPLFYRLRYSVLPDTPNLTAFSPQRGILSFPRIAPYAFHLSAMGIGTPQAGRPFEFRVFTTHPLTGQPVPGVALTLDKASAVTDADGTAVLHVIPNPHDWGDLTIHGRNGDLVQSTPAPNPGLARSQVRIYTDKPLYKPGQTLHTRILALGADGRARNHAAYAISIRNDDDTVLAQENVTTSRFGIAHMDWEIPAHTPAGDYTIQVTDDDQTSTRTVEVRAYDLPSFRVTVHPDRPFYLPGQTASLEIRADFLYGKPVSGGQVRITDDDEEEDLRAGPLNAAGRFQTTLPLDPEDDLDHARFVDRHFVAYVTDPATHRTEQCPFDLRLSRDPVHVYVLQPNRTTLGLPLYVTTYTPDGNPIVAGVEVLAAGRMVGSGRTNRHGLARIEVPGEAGELTVRATTPAGAATETVRIDGEASTAVRLTTDRSLYRQGQPVRCRVRSTAPALRGTLLAWNTEGQVLFSRALELAHGSTEAVIPYDTHFGHELAVAFISPRANQYQAGRTVVFPGPSELRIAAKSPRDTYRPGEQASLTFQSANANGTPVESALGIAVVDQAVMERAATDQAGARRRWFDYGERENRIGGFTRRDLLEIDPAQIDDDLQLVAETLFDSAPTSGLTADFLDEQRNAYEDAARKGLAEVQADLDNFYGRTLDYPRDETSLVRIAGVAYGKALDPWMNPYRATFETSGPRDILRFLSAGPDKKFDTPDDMVALTVSRGWFFPTGVLIGQALGHRPDYPATTAEFEKVLADAGLRFDGLRDPWQNPLRAVISYRFNQRIIEILSPGPDHTMGTADDFAVTEFTGPFFHAMAERIERVLDAAPTFPTDESQLAAILSPAGIDLTTLRDPWGRRYEYAFHTEERFSDRVQVYTYAEYQGIAEQRKLITPIKRQFLYLDIDSRGEDDVHSAFLVARFSREIAETPPPEVALPAERLPSTNLAGKGTIRGLVTDASGAGILNAEVILNGTYRTTSDLRGAYTFAGVTPGKCTLQFNARGFQKTVVDSIPVQPDHVTRVDAVLQIGQTSQQVTVAAEMPMMETNTASASLNSVAEAPSGTANFTPHIRDYFPEILLWNPELVTDAQGRASLNFKLADSITNWRVAVIASTLDGRVAETGVDIKAFQPFFVDLDPPKILTVGDEITLPAPIRSYLATAQIVSVETTAAPALRILEGARQGPKVEPSSSANAVFRLRAEAESPTAWLRVTARGSQAADAIEKPVSIHPDGEPVTRSVTDLLENGRVLRIDTPANAIPGSLHAEVRIYPGVLAHVIESMEGMLRKPTGCAEQTISSSYPNLLFLRALSRAGIKEPNLQARARRNLESGYQRLLGYRSASGGFGYWSASSPNVALTAYAVAFLEDARDLIAVDEVVLAVAYRWLSLQAPTDATVHALMLRAMAHADKKYETAVVAQLGEMARTAAGMDDPYAIAAFALAAMDAGHADLARAAIERLRGLVHDEQGAAWWHLQRNTPYYGWGRAGRIETTALALSALQAWQKHAAGDAQVQSLIDRGIVFLLRNKGADGTWLTTQATIRVFAVLMDALAAPRGAFSAEVSVNGVSAGTVHVEGPALRGPVTVDVSRLLKPGIANEVAIAAPSGHAAAQVEFAAQWYEPWQGPRNSPELALQVNYSATEATTNQPIRCDVAVSRPSFRGYGMMIAEIGLPPGAEVDRGSLENVGVDSYEVAPDHVVFYVWPSATDTRFHFTFRPRYPVHARTAPSVLYDYYNPDARAVVPPWALTVR